MSRYRARPVEIEAVQVCWRNWEAVCELAGDVNCRFIPEEETSDQCGEPVPYIAFEVTTTHGERATVRHGDFLIPDGGPGRFYPCKPAIFHAKYEAIR